jgi:hypothetical protein
MYAVCAKALAGNIRAKRTLMKYDQFAQTHSNKEMRVTFVDSDYTRAVARYFETGDE